MTYLQFHLLFNIPLLLLLAVVGRRYWLPVHSKWLGIICLIVVGFTFPWDHWAVGAGIWEFGEGRVLFRIWNLPVEEVLFFVLETVAVCLVTLHFLPKRSGGKG